MRVFVRAHIGVVWKAAHRIMLTGIGSMTMLSYLPRQAFFYESVER